MTENPTRDNENKGMENNAFSIKLRKDTLILKRIQDMEYQIKALKLKIEVLSEEVDVLKSKSDQ